MRNFKIEKVHESYFIVTADSARFGENEIVFEGISLEECSRFICENAEGTVWVDKVNAGWGNHAKTAPARETLEKLARLGYAPTLHHTTNTNHLLIYYRRPNVKTEYYVVF